MEMIKSWVRDLVILVIFASMLEMLLPNGTLKKYVKLVIGFFMMLALLNPILSFFRADYTAFYPFNTLPNGKSQQAQIQHEGAKIQKANETMAVNAFQNQLEQQIRALILTQGEVEDARVQVKATENGTIQAIQIGLNLVRAEEEKDNNTTSSCRVETVKPVKINLQSRTENTQYDSQPLTQVVTNSSGFSNQGARGTTDSSNSSSQSVRGTTDSSDFSSQGMQGVGDETYASPSNRKDSAFSDSARPVDQSKPESRKTNSVNQNQVQRVQDKVTKLIASFYNIKPDAISFQ